MKKLASLIPYMIMITTIVAIITNTVSCNNHDKHANTASDTLLYKKITFPDSLFLLDDLMLKKPDSLIMQIRNKTKIISIIDGDCVKCIVMQLNKLDNIFNSILSNNNGVYITILNVRKQDSAYFMHNIQPLIDANGIILWDDNYHFESQNKLFTKHRNLRTFMISANNKIIQYGNPIIHPEVLSQYKEKLISAKY